MKKSQLPLPGKRFLQFLFIFCIAASLVRSQSMESLIDENNDGFSDDISHQALHLNPDAYVNVKDTGDVVHYISTPGPNCQGLTFDGNYLWCSDIGSETIYQVDPVDGAIMKSFDAPGGSVEGLAWDGTHLWAAENGGGPNQPSAIYKIDPDNGSVISFFEPDGVWIHGLTWDGQYLWMIDYDTHMIYKVDPISGTNLQSINAPAGQCVGLTWDGNYLWTDDFGTDKLYCLSPENGSVIYEVNSPHTNPRDLAWDGTYLWVVAAAAGIIYQVDVGYTTSIHKIELSPGNVYNLSVFPNPIGSNTTIVYHLSHSQNIRLHLYNASGVLIGTLANTDQTQGDHRLTIDADPWEAGIYYFVLQAGREIKAIKLVKL